jgi:transcription elongation factor GreA
LRLRLKCIILKIIKIKNKTLSDDLKLITRLIYHSSFIPRQARDADLASASSIIFMPDQIISQEGYNKLQEEHDFLLNIRRKEIADRIEKAKELGDLSENAEYHEAKDAQAFNEGRLIELTTLLKNLTVVESDGQSNGSGKAAMGSQISVKNIKTGEERNFSIVSFNEAAPAEGKISNESPLGMAFVGRKKGDEVTVETPKGEMKYKILKVE